MKMLKTVFLYGIVIPVCALLTFVLIANAMDRRTPEEKQVTAACNMGEVFIEKLILTADTFGDCFVARKVDPITYLVAGRYRTKFTDRDLTFTAIMHHSTDRDRWFLCAYDANDAGYKAVSDKEGCFGWERYKLSK